MTLPDYTHILTQAVDELSDSRSYQGLMHRHKDGDPLPSSKSLEQIVELARAILFPGYFGNSTVNSSTINYHIKGIPRHPILEDDVIVYANATILGRITIGRGATIGGNIWVTEDVEEGARIVQRKTKDE